MVVVQLMKCSIFECHYLEMGIFDNVNTIRLKKNAILSDWHMITIKGLCRVGAFSQSLNVLSLSNYVYLKKKLSNLMETSVVRWMVYVVVWLVGGVVDRWVVVW